MDKRGEIVSNASPEIVFDAAEKEPAPKSEAEKILEKYGEFPENYHVGAEHEVLFSTVVDEADNSNYPVVVRENVTFTALGMEYQTKRLPYKPEVKQEIHEVATVELFEKQQAEDGNLNIKSVFDKQNSFWTVPLADNIRRKRVPEEQSEYKAKREQYQEQLAAKKEGKKNAQVALQEEWFATDGKRWIGDIKRYQDHMMKVEKPKRIDALCRRNFEKTENEERQELEKSVRGKIADWKKEDGAAWWRDVGRLEHPEIETIQNNREKGKAKRRILEEHYRSIFSQQIEADAEALKKRQEKRREEWSATTGEIWWDKTGKDIYQKKVQDRLSSTQKKEYREWLFNKIKALAISENIMSEEEADRYRSYRKNREEVLQELFGKIFPRLTDQAAVNEHLVGIEQHEVDAHKNDPDCPPNFVIDASQRLSDAIWSSQSDLEQCLDNIKIDSRREEAEAMISQLEDMARDYAGNLLPKFLKARYELNKIYAGEEEQHENIDLEKEKVLIKERTERVATEGVLETKKKIAEIFFPDSKDTCEDTMVLSTGIVVKFKDGKIKAAAISPLDKRIVSLFDESLRSGWEMAWKTRQGESDNVARRVLASKIKENTAENCDDFDTKVRDTLDMYQIEPPETFNEYNGNAYDTIQKDDLELLEGLLPDLGGFVKKVDLTTNPKREASLAEARIETTKYLAGGPYLSESMLLVKSGCTLKLREIERLIENTDPQKANRVNGRIASELGVSLYNDISAKERNAFSGLIAPAADVSESSFYKNFKTSIPNPNERRRVVERTLFLHEFTKYIVGNSSGEIKEYFDALKKKSALSGNVQE